MLIFSTSNTLIEHPWDFSGTCIGLQYMICATCEAKVSANLGNYRRLRNPRDRHSKEASNINRENIDILV